MNTRYSLMNEGNQKNYLFYLFLLLCYYVQTTHTYLLLVDDTQQPGDVIFNASVYRLGSDRFYKINEKRSAPFVQSLVHVDSKTGQISLIEGLQCNGLYYPNLFTIHIDSTSNRLRDITYYSLPLRIFIIGKDCSDHTEENLEYLDEFSSDRGLRQRRDAWNPFSSIHPSIKQKITEARQWVSETYASFAIPTAEKWQKICLRQSQFINSVLAFLPSTISTFCTVTFHYVSDDRFKIEQSQGDLVASMDVCIIEPLWKVTILFTTNCRNVSVLNSEHRLKIVYYHQQFNDTDIAKRVRRELRNQSPFFEQHLYVASVLEECDPPVVVTTVKARDPENSPITYSMTSLLDSRTQAMFDIDQKTGVVTTKVQLDRELVDVHYFRVTALDDSFPPRSGTTMLQINVLDANDHSPVFEMTEYDASIKESVSVGTTVITLKATDQDIGKNADVEYSIRSINGGGTSSEDDDNHAFKIDSKTGVVTTRTSLDRETTEVYTLIVQASDMASPQTARRSSSASIVIHILDDNDNYPQFSERTYTVTLNEDINYNDNSVVAHIKATDADEGVNAAIRYAIISTPVATVTAVDPDEDSRLHYEISNGNTRGRFAITSQNGHGLITIAQPLDYKQEKRYILTVKAADSGGRFDTATVYINITDANNFAPVFENAPYSSSVFEDAAVGTTVLVVSATDNDVGLNAQITYSLGDDLNDMGKDSSFSVNPQTGAIVTTKLLDRETVSGYLLTVTAKDGGSPPLSDTTDVEITVTDVNDNYPVFKQPSYSGSVPEDALVGTSVVQVSATDADVGLNGRIHYSLSEKDLEDGSFLIDPMSGVIRTNKGLDRESVAFYELEAYAIDRGSPTLSSSVPVTIKIEDVNDSPPAFDSDKIVLYIPENSPIGSTVGEIYAKDPDEGVNAIVQYSIIGGEDSQSFSLITRPGSEKAELLSMVELDYESPKKRFDLVVRAASPPLRSDAHVEVIVTDVNDNAPILKDFQVVFNNFRDCFPTGPIGKIPAFDADVSDKLHYRILSGNNANLLALNDSSGQLQLSPQLNTNVPKVASMEVSATDGVNEVKAIMTLTVRLITEEMLFNSITVRLNQMTKEAFLSPLLGYFLDGLAAIIPCPRENIFIFSIQDDTDVRAKILNVSFSVRRPDVPKEEYYSPQFLQERVYLNRGILARLSTVQILPFDDNLCVREPCLNYEECLTVLKFGNASGFIASDTVLFRPIYPVTTFTCQCPRGFTGSKEHYLCDTEVNLCYSSPCKNNGTCKVREGGYTCVCPSNYTGENCDLKIENGLCGSSLCHKDKSCSPAPGRSNFVCEDCNIVGESEHYTSMCQLRSRSFTKTSFLTFPSLKQRHRLHLSMKFATQAQNGLLLYNGRYNEQHDFIALEIIKGHIQFSFSLGSEVTKVSATVPGGVSDGKWHTVNVNYFNKTATISLDNCDTAIALKRGRELGERWACAGYAEHKLEPRCASLTETCHRFLDLTGPLQLGGVPSESTVFQIQNFHYEGCISQFEIDYKFLDLNSFVTDNDTTAGCPEKRSFCSSMPCKNGGGCVEGWSMYQCTCPEGFGGRDCSETISTPWHFSGDGTLSFNPLLRPIQLPWLNALSVRTLQEDTFLMSVQIGQNSSAVISLSKGLLHYTYNGESLVLTTKFVSDGEWHHIEVTWIGTEIKLSLDYGESVAVLPFSEKIQGLYVGKTLIGGPDNTYTSLNAGYNYLEGCVQDVRIGNQQATLNRPTVKENVEDGCFSLNECQTECPASSQCIIDWGRSHCECNEGYVGPLCAPVCQENPCQNGGTCIEDHGEKKGYRCDCNSTVLSGEYCESKQSQPCPASWWGYPVCGPCQCNTEAGYNPDCDKKTGKCHCRENHYQPKESTECLPCDCYNVGSYSTQCDHESGQCKCRDGVIGLKCDSCPNTYAEITLKGCEVVYDGCPRSASNDIWWPRTVFGSSAIETCPRGSHGKASRSCDNDLGGWQEPDMFNCTSERFVELREQLSNIEKGLLQLNTFVSIKLAYDLYRATNLTKDLYGADILISYELMKELLNYEFKVNGLNLTHSQDKDYINNLVHSVSVVLSETYENHWMRIKELTGESSEQVIALIEKYIRILAVSQHDTYTSPFEIVAPNMVVGLDVVTAESLFGFEPSNAPPPIHLTPTKYTTESVILPDTSSFLEENVNSQPGPMVSFPKYNNYLLDKSKFDQHTRILIPLKLLGINPVETGEIITKHSLPIDGAVVSYAQYKEAGMLLPKSYDDSVVRRWGIDITIGSPLISVSVLVPERNDVSRSKSEHGVTFKDESLSDAELEDRDIWNRKNYNEPNVQEHDAQYQRIKREKKSNGNLSYKSLSGVRLPVAVRLQILLDSNYTVFNERSNPQCVHWSTVRGNTSRPECFSCKLVAISLHYLWLASFSWMLVDAVHLYRMLTEMRDINHGPMRFYYSMGYVAPAVVVSLSVGVRAHQYGNYYFCWVSLYESVVWSLVGPICLLVFVNLFVLVFSIRAAFTLQDHVLGFGNLRTLLWVSVIALPLLGATWVLALLGASENHPLLTPFLSVAVLIHAGFSLAGYCFANNRVRQNLLRSMMRCVGKKVPLLETNSVVGVPSTSSQNINAQSRSALAYHSSLDPTRRNIGISTSSTTSRSTTKTSSSPYRSDTHLRNTSTSTSNYNSTSDVPSYLRGFEQEGGSHRNREVQERRDERRERRTDKGDSDSDSDGSEGRSLELASSHSSDDDESSTRRHQTRNIRQGYLPNITEHVASRCGTPPSLNVVTNSQLFPTVQPNYGSRWSSQLPESYLPNPNVPEVGRWSAGTGSDNEFCHKNSSPNPLPPPGVAPETCLSTLQSEQYMVRAHYDNCYGPNTIPYKGEYMPKMIPHDNMNYQEHVEKCLDVEEKQHMNEKYLFPYTAEEDHVTSHNYMHPLHSSNVLMSPVTNDINNPGVDYHGSTVGSHMGSRIGSVLGSVHGSLCGSLRGSPSPMMPPVSMIHSAHHPEPPQWCWDYTTKHN
nr:protocadherin-like wing polarity protein stan [Leptinotarsa decemlineata]